MAPVAIAIRHAVVARLTFDNFRSNCLSLLTDLPSISAIKSACISDADLYLSPGSVLHARRMTSFNSRNR